MLFFVLFSVVACVWRFEWVYGEDPHDAECDFTEFQHSTPEPWSRMNSQYALNAAGNRLYMFGGSFYEYDSGDDPWNLNDFWYMDVDTWTWTYLGGVRTWGRWLYGEYDDDGPGCVDGYGTKGVPSSSNWPPNRYYGTMEQVNDVLYMIGGRTKHDHNGFRSNEIWTYDIASGVWTWVHGDSGLIDTDNSDWSWDMPEAGYHMNNKLGSTYKHGSTNDGTIIYIYGGTFYGSDYTHNCAMIGYRISDGYIANLDGGDVEYYENEGSCVAWYSTKGEESSDVRPGYTYYYGGQTRMWFYDGYVWIYGDYPSSSIFKWNTVSTHYTWVAGNPNVTDIGDRFPPLNTWVNDTYGHFPPPGAQNQGQFAVDTVNGYFYYFSGDNNHNDEGIISGQDSGTNNVADLFWQFDLTSGATLPWRLIGGSATAVERWEGDYLEDSKFKYWMDNYPAGRGGAVMTVLPNDKILLWGGMPYAATDAGDTDVCSGNDGWLIYEHCVGGCAEGEVCVDDSCVIECDFAYLDQYSDCLDCVDPLFDPVDTCSSCLNPLHNVSADCLTCLNPLANYEEDCVYYCGGNIYQDPDYGCAQCIDMVNGVFPGCDPLCNPALGNICYDGITYETLQDAIDAVTEGSGINTIYVKKDVNHTAEGRSIKIGRVENQKVGTSANPITITVHPDVEEVVMHCFGPFTHSDDVYLTYINEENGYYHFEPYFYFGASYWKLSGNFRLMCEYYLDTWIAIGPGIGGKTTIEGITFDASTPDYGYGILIFENTTEKEVMRDYAEVYIDNVRFEGYDGDYPLYFAMGNFHIGAHDNPEEFFTDEHPFKVHFTNSYVEEADDYPMDNVDETNVFGLYVYNVEFRANLEDEDYVLDFDGTVTRMRIENCVFGGIYIDASDKEHHGLWEIEFINNIMTYETFIYSIDKYPNSDAVIFRGNYMRYVYLEYTGAEFYDNVIYDDSNECIEYYGYMMHRHHIKIVGNTMYCKDTGIYLYSNYGVWRFTIEDNVIDAAQPLSYDNAIETGYCDQGIIKNNHITGHHYQVIEVEYCDVIIDGNTIIQKGSSHEVVYLAYGQFQFTNNYVEQNGNDYALYTYYADELMIVSNNYFDCRNPLITTGRECVYFEYNYNTMFDDNVIVSDGQGVYFYGDSDLYFQTSWCRNNNISSYSEAVYYEYMTHMYINDNILYSEEDYCIYQGEDCGYVEIKGNRMECPTDCAIYNNYFSTLMVIEDNFIKAEYVYYCSDGGNLEFRRNIVDNEYLDYEMFYAYYGTYVIEDNYFYNIDYDGDELFYMYHSDGSREPGTLESSRFINNVFEIQSCAEIFEWDTDQLHFNMELIVANNLFLFNESEPLQEPLFLLDPDESGDSAFDNFYFVNNVLIGDFSEIDSLIVLDDTYVAICENECEIQFNYLSPKDGVTPNFTDITDLWIRVDRNLNIENNFVIEPSSVFDFTFAEEDCFGMEGIPECYRPQAEVSAPRWNWPRPNITSIDHDLALDPRPRDEWVTIGPFEFECPQHFGGFQCLEMIAIFCFGETGDEACGGEHGRCLGPNNCQCEPEWDTDIVSNCTVPFCWGEGGNKGCHHHGVCVDYNECICDENWSYPAVQDCSIPTNGLGTLSAADDNEAATVSAIVLGTLFLPVILVVCCIFIIFIGVLVAVIIYMGRGPTETLWSKGISSISEVELTDLGISKEDMEDSESFSESGSEDEPTKN